MEFSVIQSENLIAVHWPGKNLAARNADVFRKMLLSIIQRKNNIFLDMSNIDYIDSVGLGTLLTCLRQAQKNGNRFVLGSLTHPVRILCEQIEAYRMFDIYNNIEEVQAVLNR